MPVVDEIDVYIRRREKEIEKVRAEERRKQTNSSACQHYYYGCWWWIRPTNQEYTQRNRKAKTEEETGEMTHKRT